MNLLILVSPSFVSLEPEWLAGPTEAGIHHIGLMLIVTAMAVVSRRSDDARQKIIAEQAEASAAQARELEVARDAALAAAKARSSFLANVSHEIRTPLNAVIGLTDLLLRGPLEADQREHLEAVEASGRGLLELVDEILDFSKLDAEQLRIDPRPVDLGRLLDRVASIFRPVCEARGIDFEVNLASATPRVVLVDDLRLRQVLVNLIGNAAKFTDAGSIRVEVAPEGEGRLRLAVHDTGPGIPASALPILFAPFRQGEEGATRRHGGVGLGLTIVKALVERMEGSVRVESVEGRGSTFTVSLPAPETKEHPSTSAPLDRVRLAEHLPMRVIIAEDNPVNQLVAQRILRHLGYDAVLVADGASLVEQVRAGHFDVALVDLQMPVLDGIRAARAMAALPNTPYMVAVTANVLPEQRRACEAAGMLDFVEKPVTVGNLSAALTKAAEALRSVTPAEG